MSTADERHYNRAPIVEAIFGFDVPRMTNEAMPALAAMGQHLSGDYPELVATNPGSGSTPDPDGYAFRSGDGKQIVRAGLDGFAFSRLAPYDRWETFIEEARRTWCTYRDVVAVKEIEGFWTRYINKFQLPFGVPLHRFFNVYPAVPNRDELFTKLFMFTETAILAPPGHVAVTMAPTGKRDDENKRFELVLDNAFRFAVRNEEMVWSSIAEIRRIKNATFEAQLTDELKETIS